MEIPENGGSIHRCMHPKPTDHEKFEQSEKKKN